MSQLHGTLIRLNNEGRVHQLALTNAIDNMQPMQAGVALAKLLRGGFDMADTLKLLNPTAYETVVDEIRLSYERAGLALPGYTPGQPPAGAVPTGKVNDAPPPKPAAKR
jgi:hypothetical protein